MSELQPPAPDTPLQASPECTAEEGVHRELAEARTALPGIESTELRRRMELALIHLESSVATVVAAARADGEASDLKHVVTTETTALLRSLDAFVQEVGQPLRDSTDPVAAGFEKRLRMIVGMLRCLELFVRLDATLRAYANRVLTKYGVEEKI